MKRWTLMIVAMVSALALIATPALAADQTRSQDRIQDQLQDGTCADCTVECDQLQLRTGDQTQTRLQECDPAQVQAGEQVQAMTQTKTATQLQTMTQTKTQAGEQVQAMTQTQAGEQVQAMTQTQAHAAEWAEKLARHQNQHKYAKCVQTITSSD